MIHAVTRLRIAVDWFVAPQDNGAIVTTNAKLNKTGPMASNGFDPTSHDGDVDDESIDDDDGIESFVDGPTDSNDEDIARSV